MSQSFNEMDPGSGLAITEFFIRKIENHVTTLKTSHQKLKQASKNSPIDLSSTTSEDSGDNGFVDANLPDNHFDNEFPNEKERSLTPDQISRMTKKNFPSSKREPQLPRPSQQQRNPQQLVQKKLQSVKPHSSFWIASTPLQASFAIWSVVIRYLK